MIETDYINGILTDRDGGVWLLTTFAGVYRTESGEGELVNHQLAPNIRSFAQLNDGRIAVGDMEGHVFGYNPDTGQGSLLFDKGFRAYAINTDSKGRLWIGTRGGGLWMDGKRIDNFPAQQVYDIVFSENGTVWVATLDGGLIEGLEGSRIRSTEGELDDESFVFFPDLQTERIHELDIDKNGQLWMATEHGILMRNEERTDTIFNKGKVVCICHDANGTIWAGSNGYGLIRIKKGEISFIQADNGLANNCVESVVCDDKGNVIVGTDQGISIVSSEDGSIHNVYSQQGLRDNTYNENAILYASSGRVFLGSLTGLVEFTPKAMGVGNGSKMVCGRPLLTSILVNDEPRYDGLTGDIRLAHDKNNLCFSFSSFAYKNLASVVYSYWLEGVENHWRPSTKESQALYTNLAPGHYRLHVRSRLAGTQWSEETVCNVYIAQPWYWTWWARALYLLLLVLLVLYEQHQYQQRLSLRRQLDQRLAALYAIEAQHNASLDTNMKQIDSYEQATNLQNDQTTKQPDDQTTEQPSEQTAKRQNDQKEEEFIGKLDRLILENLLQTDLDVNFIAQEMCMSYSTLHRRIKSLTGMTANEYVRKHRLAKAMQLLHDGHNATEVSMLCGFNSPSYFTRCFKAEYGLLPSEVD